MIRITNLVKAFDNVVLRYPDIIANKGDFVLICGDSGTGKSTLCEMVAKFTTQDSGDIFINGIDSRKLNVFESIHYLSQFPDNNLIGPTCYEEVELWLSSQETENRNDFIKNKLNEFLLGGLIDMPVWKLSFGKKKALAFCCISVIKRDIWILDEPFAGLDSEMHVVIKNMLHEFINSGGIIIATSHSDEGFECFKTIRIKL
jgi:heme exporter protein A